MCNERVPRFTLRRLLWAVTAFCVMVFVARFLLTSPLLPYTSAYWENVSRIYSLWQSEEMLSMFLARHPGQSPAGWEELAREFNDTNGPYGTPSLSVLEERIEIDFAALDQAMATKGPTEKWQETPIIRLRPRRAGGVETMGTEESRINQRLTRSIRASLDKAK